MRCDLLENSYLCGISNNYGGFAPPMPPVVICLKIRTFVVSATTSNRLAFNRSGCDLLENSYLCGISNNVSACEYVSSSVVICLKIRTLVVSATTLIEITQILGSCDLLENSYLCGISNNYIIRYLIQAML